MSVNGQANTPSKVQITEQCIVLQLVMLMYGQIVGTGVGCMLLASLAGTPGEIFRILSFEY